MKKYLAETLGTMTLVLFGCGVAIVSGGDLVATALAFGLSILGVFYVIDEISGCHINPAVSISLLVAKKMSVKDCAFYCLAQVVGSLLACVLLGLFFGFDCGFGANYVPDTNAVSDAAQAFTWTNANYFIAFLVEMVLTCTFVVIVLRVTSRKKTRKNAGFLVALALTLVHLFAIRLTGTSVNPARSLGPAIFNMFDGNFEPIKQIWIFILAPICGGILAALSHCFFFKEEKEEEKANN